MSRISKSWRRSLAVGAVATLVAGLATACGGGGGSDEQAKLGKDDVLTITTFSNFGYADLIKQWNADPDRPFTVKETVISEWDTWKQSLTSGLQAGTGLTDIVAVEGDAMPAFLAEGASDQFVDDVVLEVREAHLLDRLDPLGVAGTVDDRRGVLGHHHAPGLAEHVQVTGASLENGLLHVELKREIPEAKKPRQIPIGTGSAKVIDAKKAA